uniref:Reverse transcriptase domain-containing protein n=1 Tax=Caenorhabditis tropicalis TaxID=1561998 RepID=A0A1I7TPC9_9PELO
MAAKIITGAVHKTDDYCRKYKHHEGHRGQLRGNNRGGRQGNFWAAEERRGSKETKATVTNTVMRTETRTRTRSRSRSRSRSNTETMGKVVRTTTGRNNGDNGQNNNWDQFSDKLEDFDILVEPQNHEQPREMEMDRFQMKTTIIRLL